MILTAKNKNKFSCFKHLNLISYFILLINVGFLCWYLFLGYKASFHSDSAAKVLIASEIYDTCNYFPTDWNHVNYDLFVLFGHTFVIPLLTFLPAGFLAHSISGFISSVVILSGIWFLTSIVPISKTRRMLIVSVFAGGISGLSAENLFGQVSYGWIVCFSCYFVFFSLRFILAEDRKNLLWGVGLLALTVLAFWANVQRAAFYYGFPLISALILILLRYKLTFPISNIKKIMFCLGIFSIGILIGLSLHLYTLFCVNNVLGAGHARWLTYDSMIFNIMQTPKGILAIFGGLPTQGGLLTSKIGVYEAFRLTTVIVILILMPIAVNKMQCQQDASMNFLAYFSIFSFLFAIFFQLTTTIPNSDVIQSSRYLIPSLMFGLIAVLIQPVDLYKSPVLGLSLIYIFIILLSAGYHALVMSDVNSNTSGKSLQNQHLKKMDFLIKNNLRYGYATYWNAGVVSVLSNGKSVVRQIVIIDGVPMPMRHLSSNRWYLSSAWKDESFLLLTSLEAKNLNWKQMAEYGLIPSRELTYDDYNVYVFKENIAKYIPGWKTPSGDRMRQPLPASGFKAKIEPQVQQLTMKMCETSTVSVKITNTGDSRLSSVGKNGGLGALTVALAYHVLDNEGNVVVFDGKRTALPGNVMPNQTVLLNAILAAPVKAGKYTFVFDLVQEGVSWFEGKGNAVSTIKVTVD